MQLKKIIENLNYEILFGEIDKKITGVTCDSRKCKKDFIFVAIIGFESDGHNFIGNAIENGATCIVYEAKRGIDLSEFQNRNITFIKVKDTRKVYSLICNIFYDFPSKQINLIGITGTNGKTTISYIIEKLLENTGVIGTVNYRFKDKIFKGENTTPLPCDINFYIKKFSQLGAKNVVMEVSSHGLDLSRVDYLDFDIGIFTNLSSEHLDYHKDMDNYFKAKERFFTEIIPNSKKHNKVAIINIDDEYGEKLLNKIDYPCITFSLKNKEANIFCKEYSLKLYESEYKVNVSGKKINIKTNLIGEHNIYNMLAAIAVLKCLNQKIDDLNVRINIPGRLERVVEGRNIFIDYAHTDDALKNVLTSLSNLKSKNSKIITVFGCGGDRDKQKRPKMGYIAAKYSDFVVITSDNPRTENPVLIIENILEGVKRASKKGLLDENQYRVIPDREDAIQMSIKMANKDDIVLIAGKGHEDYQIIGKEKKYFSDKETVEKFIK